MGISDVINTHKNQLKKRPQINDMVQENDRRNDETKTLELRLHVPSEMDRPILTGSSPAKGVHFIHGYRQFALPRSSTDSLLHCDMFYVFLLLRSKTTAGNEAGSLVSSARQIRITKD
jgi:hypothetical protein